MEALREIIAQSEPLLIFLVIGLGFMFGQIRFGKFKFGVAGVLFVGLFFGGWRPGGTEPLMITHQVMQVGLILFVYTVGLASGPGFFSSLKSNGLKFNLALIFSLTAGAFVTMLFGVWMKIEVGQIAGVFCGGLTNTPALASVTELIRNSAIGDPRDPAVGYSVSYPFGILGGMLAFQLFSWFYRDAAQKERLEVESRESQQSNLVSANFVISNKKIYGCSIGELEVQKQTGLIISRHKHKGGGQQVPTKYTILNKYDVITAVGQKNAIEKAEKYFGSTSTVNLEADRGEVTMRRILVSKKELAGKKIQELGIDRSLHARVTRLRRADKDIIPDDSTALQVGDRVRVVMPVRNVSKVSIFFGDSERGIAELDYTALTLGISFGVLIGMIPIPIPGGAFVSLGFAGGPLVAGLLLGRLQRSGALVWTLPTESNNALRHMGLLLFLAAVGVMAGGRFFTALSDNGMSLFVLGLLTTTITTALTLLLLRHFCKASIISSIGATSGMQTQPATLARAYEMSKSDETYVAYATTYPVAMVGKILLAQLIPILLNTFLN